MRSHAASGAPSATATSIGSRCTSRYSSGCRAARWRTKPASSIRDASASICTVDTISRNSMSTSGSACAACASSIGIIRYALTAVKPSVMRPAPPCATRCAALGPRGKFEDVPRVAQKPLAGRGQADLPAAAFEQRDAERMLEQLDLPAERRLGHEEPPRAEMQLLGDRDETAKLVQFNHPNLESIDSLLMLDAYRCDFYTRLHLMHGTAAPPTTETFMTIDILLTQPLPDAIDAELSARYAVHRLYAADQPDALLDRVAARIRGVVTGGANGPPR